MIEKNEIYKRKGKIVQNITLSTLLCNILLAFGKLFGGIFGFSKALISDSINSFGDIITSIISLVGAKISRKKPDEDHPYGHERLESIAIIIFEMIVIFSGLIIGYQAIMSLINLAEINDFPDMIALIVSGIAIFIKLALFTVAFIFYKRTKSAILKAQMLDHLFDSIGTFLSLIAIIIAINFNVVWIDSAMSLVICCIVIYTGVKILLENINKLVDKSWDEEHINMIKEIVLGHEHIKSIDSLKTRMFGERIYIDIELSMDRNMKICDSHDIIDHIEKEIENEFIEVIHVDIHVNPC